MNKLRLDLLEICPALRGGCVEAVGEGGILLVLLHLSLITTL